MPVHTARSGFVPFEGRTRQPGIAAGATAGEPERLPSRRVGKTVLQVSWNAQGRGLRGSVRAARSDEPTFDEECAYRVTATANCSRGAVVLGESLTFAQAVELMQAYSPSYGLLT